MTLSQEQLAATLAQRLDGIANLIGNTPLLAIEVSFRGTNRTIFAKAEHLNLTGSIKDRMAFHMLRRAHERGTLRPGGAIIEATSGNAGISFAAIGRALGHPVTIFMPDYMSRERQALIRSFGAEIALVSAEQGGFECSIRLAEEMAARLTDAFLPRQFSNPDNCDAHTCTTGPEIWWQLQAAFLQGLDHFRRQAQAVHHRRAQAVLLGARDVFCIRIGQLRAGLAQQACQFAQGGVLVGGAGARHQGGGSAGAFAHLLHQDMHIGTHDAWNPE